MASDKRPPQLQNFSNPHFVRGRPAVVEAIWLLVQWLLVTSWLPGSAHRKLLLRMFGARIGDGVVVKPGLRVKFPWKLQVGNQTWIGEDVWIDNLAPVSIGANCCLSQDAYLCTGSHDWSSATFDLIVRPIEIGDGAWIAARCSIGPGVTVGEGAVLGLGSVATRDLLPWTIYTGAPAAFHRERSIRGVAAAQSRAHD